MSSWMLGPKNQQKIWINPSETVFSLSAVGLRYLFSFNEPNTWQTPELHEYLEM